MCPPPLVERVGLHTNLPHTRPRRRFRNSVAGRGRRLAARGPDRPGSIRCRALEPANANEAPALWSQHGWSIELLLTDLVMPGPIHARKLAKRLQCERPNLRVTLFSGYSPELAGRPWEFQDRQIALPRSFAPETLLAVVRQFLINPPPGNSYGRADSSGDT